MTGALPLYIVDAFADRPFAGNPAAVVPLEEWLPDEVLQGIAAEHNLSETAFVVAEPEGLSLRWFTPTVEVPLCGHATLAAAFVLATERGLAPPFAFRTRSGELRVTREDGLYVLDFPANPPVRTNAPPGLAGALGATPREVWKGRDWIAVFDDAATVRALAPDHARLAALPGEDARTIATAPGDGGADVVSRYFAAKIGIPEDPVTGAAHVQLVPLWAARLDKDRLTCVQASRRGGTLHCRLAGDRVLMAGAARLYARGEIVAISS
ncbi:PhzF family phenazine biosynthesis protein [Elioraea sp. Yellowstone]|jgi:PhzF family phenazine biosynthesis protein|uniref:PhzF family phenazine biosynthesis protein n=1 Tax=Elioraea sp. Yellowstone TaxID=2592070 RepID=UPI00115243CC|nr:PhzF family phenazine biosynthesis protein [Elioraea sp. Yellowstone]TQF80840.1 PhzF family phenazine biosynthesis protein [Elioraea sp. Yellowstone]